MWDVIAVQRRFHEHVGGSDVNPRRVRVARSSRSRLDRSRRNQSTVDRHVSHAGRGQASTCRRCHPAHGRGRRLGRVAGDGWYRQLADVSQLDQCHRLPQSVHRQNVTRAGAVQQLVAHYEWMKFLSNQNGLYERLSSEETDNSLRVLGTLDWLSSVLRPRQHRIGYMGDGFYRSQDATNSVKVLKEQIVHRQIKHTISRHEFLAHAVHRQGRTTISHEPWEGQLPVRSRWYLLSLPRTGRRINSFFLVKVSVLSISSQSLSSLNKQLTFISSLIQNIKTL